MTLSITEDSVNIKEQSCLLTFLPDGLSETNHLKLPERKNIYLVSTETSWLSQWQNTTVESTHHSCTCVGSLQLCLTWTPVPATDWASEVSEVSSVVQTALKLQLPLLLVFSSNKNNCILIYRLNTECKLSTVSCDSHKLRTKFLSESAAYPSLCPHSELIT